MQGCRLKFVSTPILNNPLWAFTVWYYGFLKDLDFDPITMRRKTHASESTNGEGITYQSPKDPLAGNNFNFVMRGSDHESRFDCPSGYRFDYTTMSCRMIDK